MFTGCPLPLYPSYRDYNNVAAHDAVIFYNHFIKNVLGMLSATVFSAVPISYYSYRQHGVIPGPWVLPGSRLAFLNPSYPTPRNHLDLANPHHLVP